MMASLLVAAVALWLWVPAQWPLRRIDEPGAAAPRAQRGPADVDDPFDTAAACDLFALALRSGLSLSAAARAIAATTSTELSAALCNSADLLALGASAEQAWQREEGAPTGYTQIAELARRSARSGASLSDGLAELADSIRVQAHDTALEAAERAGVKISGPLGLCFLPAFICLGIVPVVVGLAGDVLGQ